MADMGGSIDKFNMVGFWILVRNYFGKFLLAKQLSVEISEFIASLVIVLYHCIP